VRGEDQTPSQVVRRLIREYIEKRTGRPWEPHEREGRVPALGAQDRGRDEKAEQQRAAHQQPVARRQPRASGGWSELIAWSPTPNRIAWSTRR
jgi:hypothetical protein